MYHTSLQAPRTSAYQAAPSGRNTTTTTLLPGQVLGFPPVRGGAWGRGRPDALQEGTMAPTGVTASVPASRPRFLPSAKHPHPERSDALHQTSHPRTCAATDLPSSPPPHRGHRSETDEDEREQPGTRNGSEGSHAGGDNLHRHRRSPTGRDKGSVPGPRGPVEPKRGS